MLLEGRSAIALICSSIVICIMVESRPRSSQAQNRGYAIALGPRTRYLTSLPLHFLLGKMGIPIFYFTGSKTFSKLHLNISALREHLAVGWVLWIIVDVTRHFWWLILSLRGRVCSIFVFVFVSLVWIQTSVKECQLVVQILRGIHFPSLHKEWDRTYQVYSYLFSTAPLFHPYRYRGGGAIWWLSFIWEWAALFLVSYKVVGQYHLAISDVIAVMKSNLP